MSTGKTRVLVFVVGMAALAGQVSWSRLAATVVGGTFAAWAWTLFGAMSGLALGAAFSSLAKGRVRLILLSGGLTLLLMPFALLSLCRLEGMPSLRGFACAALLVVGHIPFGAFLPTVLTARKVESNQVAAVSGELYALMALGGVLGAVGAGELILSVLALDHLGILLGAIVLVSSVLVSGETSGLVSVERNSVDTRPEKKLLGVAFGVGLFGLSTESLWLRVLGFYWESNTLCFALVVASTVAGFSLGSWAGSAISRRWNPGRREAAVSLGLVALALSISAALAPQAVHAISATDRIAITLVLVGVPAAFSGTALILLLGCIQGKGPATRTLGLLSAANSSGAAAGPLLLWAAGPWVSWPPQLLFLIAGGYAALIGIVAGRRSWLIGSAFAISLFIAGWLAPERPVVTDFHPTVQTGGALDTITLPFVRPALDSTVTVTRETRTGVEVVWIDRGFQGDTSPLGRRIPEQLGRLPCELLDRPARRALVIGLGTGVTLSSIMSAGASEVDVAELSQGVLEANRTILADLNGHVLKDGRVRVHHADGRPLLLDAKSPYDLIVADMVFPTVLGAGNLFSREFYELARKRLMPDGVFVHWIPCFLLSPEDLSSVARAFMDVFPEGTAWVGCFGPRRFVLGLVGGTIKGRSRTRFALGPVELGALAGNASPIRDADPRLESRSRESGHGRFGPTNLERVMNLMRDDRRGWVTFGKAGLSELDAEQYPPGSSDRRTHLSRATELYREARAAGIVDADIHLSSLAYDRSLEMAQAASDRRDSELLLSSLRTAAAREGWGGGNIFLADVLAGRGLLEDAVRELRKALAKSPRSSDAHYRLALIYLQLGDPQTARREFYWAATLRGDSSARTP